MSLWAFRFVLFYLVFLLVQPQVRFPFLAPWRPAYVCMVIAAILHFASASRENKPIIRFGPATITALLLMMFSYISLHFGPLQTSSEWNSYIDIIFKNCLCLILIEAMATTVERSWAVMATIFIATLWWVKGGLRLSAAGETYGGDRLMGPGVSLVENPNGFAFLMALMIPVYIYFYQHSKWRIMKWGSAFCALSAIYIALQTGSRTGLLCLIATGVLCAPKLASKSKPLLLVAVVSLFFITGTVSEKNAERFRTIRQSIDEFFERVTPKSPDQMNQDELSAYERKMKNKHALGLIKQYPIFGLGVSHDDDLIPDEYAYARGQVHNDWLFAGLQLGLIGMALYASFLICLFAVSTRIHRDAKSSWPNLADLGWTIRVMTGIYIVGGFFSPITWNPLLLALVGATSALGTNYRNKSWSLNQEKV